MEPEPSEITEIPNWMFELGSEWMQECNILRDSLLSLGKPHVDSSHRSVFQMQLSDAEKASVLGFSIFKPNRLSGGSRARDNFVRASICEAGSSMRSVNTMISTKRSAGRSLGNGFLSGLASGDVLDAFLSARLLIEHIAYLGYIHKRLPELSGAQKPEECLSWLKEFDQKLIQFRYASRIDWRPLILAAADGSLDFAEMSLDQLDDGGPLKAKGIMTPIDKLNKRVKGTRNLYEVLCEFTHPNSGTEWAFTANTGNLEDTNHVFWITRELSSKVGTKGLMDFLGFYTAVIKKLNHCLNEFDVELSAWEETRLGVLSATQTVIQEALAVHGKLFDPYSLCPCESGKKLKFCCGQ